MIIALHLMELGRGIGCGLDSITLMQVGCILYNATLIQIVVLANVTRLALGIHGIAVLNLTATAILIAGQMDGLGVMNAMETLCSKSIKLITAIILELKLLHVIIP